MWCVHAIMRGVCVCVCAFSRQGMKWGVCWYSPSSSIDYRVADGLK